MSKELKAALKAAREAIRSKDYKEALKHCKVRGLSRICSVLELVWCTRDLELEEPYWSINQATVRNCP